MTGLRVFSTLHTNDAVGAVSALRNFQLSPHLVGAALQGVVAQRLLRRLCPHCRMHGVARADEMALLRQCGVTAKRKRIYRPGAGCEHCHGTGYSGRVGVFEIFKVNSEIRELIRDGASEGVVRKAALETGMITLLHSGLRKVLEGETSIEEVSRVLEL